MIAKNEGLIFLKNERLDSSHSIISGKERFKKFAPTVEVLAGNNYSNVLKLSAQKILSVIGDSKEEHWNWRFSRINGKFGKGKVVAFGDANGFLLSVFEEGDGRKNKGWNE